MITCTFFGHRYVADDIDEKLRDILIDLIEKKGVNNFYVGNHGNFDTLVKSTLISLKKDYEYIKYAVVLAYLPTERGDSYKDYSDTIYPDGIERVPPKFAIKARNVWMIGRCDYVVTYVKRDIGGAAEFKALAERKGKTVININ